MTMVLPTKCVEAPRGAAFSTFRGNAPSAPVTTWAIGSMGPLLDQSVLSFSQGVPVPNLSGLVLPG